MTPRVPVAAELWSNWTWQLRHSLRRVEDFERYFELDAMEREGFAGAEQLFNIRVSPYYASLAPVDQPRDPVRQLLMPHARELQPGVQEQRDPLGENHHRPERRLIHRYSDRVLFLVTDLCSVYCRYCTRKHFTGQDQVFLKADEYRASLEYLRRHTGVREVILSGGDPLTLSDALLERVLSDLRGLEHIELIRIGSRMPVTCPMRVTAELVQMFRRHKPVYLMTHFNHPRELTAEAAVALERCVDHGVPVFNQMVLLNGVNNHAAIVQALSRRLLYLRVKPYYMFQCDPSPGTDHLRTSVDESLDIQRELWGHLSGLAMPNLSLDIPSGGGKAPLVPNFEVEHRGDRRRFKGWDGVESEYVSPAPEQSIPPLDCETYLDEWYKLKAAKSDGFCGAL